jgi:hypothetical protein
MIAPVCGVSRSAETDASGEPGGGRLAAITALLDAFDWETGDRQYALERVEQIALGSRIESGPEPGGAAYLTAADRHTVIGALDLAADGLRDRAARCPEADYGPDFALCPACQDRLTAADDYAAVAAKLTTGDTP